METARKHKHIRCCIVGCTNIGKSSLYNKLTNTRDAMTLDYDGVTVDCRYGDIYLNDCLVTLIDTPGFDECRKESNKELHDRIVKNIERTIQSSDLIIHVIDAMTGYNIEDKWWQKQYRSLETPRIIVANKIDQAQVAHEQCYRLDNTEIVLTSAKSGHGIPELRAQIERHLHGISKDDQNDDENINERNAENEGKVILIGKPNAGKSTLMNRLCGAEVSMISAMEGTTTDTVRKDWEGEDIHITLLDTAGLRRKSKSKSQLEEASVMQTLNSIESKDAIIILVVDAKIGISDQDVRLMELVRRKRRRQILIVNKWDTLTDEEKKHYRQHAKTITRNHNYIPVIMMSAQHDKGMHKVKKAIKRMLRSESLPPTSYLTKIVEKLVGIQPPPLKDGNMIKIRLCYENSAKATAVTIQGKRVSSLTENYIRYLKNGIGRELGITGIDVHITCKDDENPYQ